MKSILISIKPKYVAHILNGNKTIEIRKRFPKDYIGWVYIYCTKDKKYIYREFNGKYFKLICSTNTLKQEIEDNSTINGQVVARFWCNKVEEINNRYCKGMLIDSCLTNHELNDYLGNYKGYAIHITKLEIFDKPKDISEFKCCLLGHNNCVPHNCSECPATKSLNRAPQSWQFINVE